MALTPEHPSPSVAVWKRWQRACGGSIPATLLPRVMDEAKDAALADIEVRAAAASAVDESQRVYTYDAQANWWVAQDGHTITEEEFARRMIPGPGRIEP